MFDAKKPMWYWGIVIGVHAISIPLLFACGWNQGVRKLERRMSDTMRDRDNNIVEVQSEAKHDGK